MPNITVESPFLLHKSLSLPCLYLFCGCTVQKFYQALRRPELPATNPRACLSVSAVATLNTKQAKGSSGEELVLPRNRNEKPSGLACLPPAEHFFQSD